MKKEIKDRIIAAAKRYQENIGISQAQLAQLSSVNPAYLSRMLKGEYTQTAGDKIVEIKDAYFMNLARAVNFDIDEDANEIYATEQFLCAISHLEVTHMHARKAYGHFKIIIGETGLGKTTAINQYVLQHPTNVFRITINSEDGIAEMLSALGDQLCPDKMPKRNGFRIRTITAELKRRAQAGEENMIIIDEAENTKLPGIRAFKAIYDLTKGYASLVLAATPDFIKLLDKLLKKKVNGIEQFYRRAKANIVYMTPIAKRDFDRFLEGIEDKGLCKLLRGLCNNYGELADYLEPARRLAAQQGVPLTETFFRAMYNMKR